MAVSWWSLPWAPERTSENRSLRPGQPRQLVGEPDARQPGGDRPVLPLHLGRGVGLGVEAVVVRQPAAQVEQDHRPRRRRARRSPSARGLGPEQGRQAEAARPPTRRKSRRLTPSHRRDPRADRDAEHGHHPSADRRDGPASIRRWPIDGRLVCRLPGRSTIVESPEAAGLDRDAACFTIVDPAGRESTRPASPRGSPADASIPPIALALAALALVAADAPPRASGRRPRSSTTWCRS